MKSSQCCGSKLMSVGWYNASVECRPVLVPAGAR